MRRFDGLLPGLGVLLCCLVLWGCQGGGGESALPKDWAKIEASAKGGVVHFYMDGSDARANAWIDGYAAEQLKQRFGITLVRVPIGADVVVERLVAEKAGGQGADVDLFCLQGGDFDRARKENLLFGPIADTLPNFVRYVNKRVASYDCGQPVEGYEVPLGWVQLVFRYAPDRVEQPPATLLDFIEWVKAHPGRFTYPMPPDPTGSAFLRQLLCTVVGGTKVRLTVWNDALFRQEGPKVWAALQQMRPGLWEGSARYPASVAELDKLFDAGEVDIALCYGPPYAADAGKNSRAFLLAGGAIGNMRFMAIPSGAGNKAGALVVANFLLSPEAQYSKFLPENWGDCPAIDMDTLDKQEWTRFDEVKLPDGALPPAALHKAALPDIAPEYGRALNAGWQANGR